MICKSEQVSAIMHELDPEGFNHRNPHFRITTKKHHGQIRVDGPNDKWAADGFEKLKGIGFGIYGIRDYWGKILGYWVVPNARDELITEYLYLTVVKRYGGVLHIKM